MHKDGSYHSNINNKLWGELKTILFLELRNIHIYIYIYDEAMKQ